MFSVRSRTQLWPQLLDWTQQQEMGRGRGGSLLQHLDLQSLQQRMWMTHEPHLLFCRGRKPHTSPDAPTSPGLIQFGSQPPPPPQKTIHPKPIFIHQVRSFSCQCSVYLTFPPSTGSGCSAMVQFGQSCAMPGWCLCCPLLVRRHSDTSHRRHWRRSNDQVKLRRRSNRRGNR